MSPSYHTCMGVLESLCRELPQHNVLEVAAAVWAARDALDVSSPDTRAALTHDARALLVTAVPVAA